MAKLRFSLAGIVLLALLTALSLLFHRPVEPVYEGQTLSYWLAGYDRGEPERQKADEIVLQAGTNAIPTLLRMLRERDFALVLKLVALVRRQHFIRIQFTFAGVRNTEAALAFGTLGAKAKDAVPELIRIYEQNISQRSRFAATSSLASIGPSASEAIPTLMTGLTNADWLVREVSADALGMIHSRPLVVVPALGIVLRDPDPRVRGAAALSLGRFGANARPAVPELVRLLEDLPYPSMQATNALDLILSRDSSKAAVK